MNSSVGVYFFFLYQRVDSKPRSCIVNFHPFNIYFNVFMLLMTSGQFYATTTVLQLDLFRVVVCWCFLFQQYTVTFCVWCTVPCVPFGLTQVDHTSFYDIFVQTPCSTFYTYGNPFWYLTYLRASCMTDRHLSCITSSTKNEIFHFIYTAKWSIPKKAIYRLDLHNNT